MAPDHRHSRRAERLVAVGLAAALSVACASIPAPAAQAQEPRIVAIGDVHGAYDSFVSLLTATELVNRQLDWSGGDARLVMLGDVLDRGAGSRRALELVIRLRDQAARAGGEAQLVLGNHEVMNLIGDLGYVSQAEFAAYAADEAPADRDAAWQRFRAASASGRDAAALAAEFAERYPPGFFGHRAAFAPRGRLGAWLLQRPVIAVVGRTAFVHGGLPPAVDGETAAEIERATGNALRDYLAAVDALRAAGVLHVENSFGESVMLATALLDARNAAAEPTRRAAERIRDFARSPLVGGDAVFWYRGTAGCSAAVERGRLERELGTLGVDRVVIGHTPTAGASVQSRFDGAVIRADTGMLTASFGGRAAAVVIRGSEVRALYADGGEETAPERQARAVPPRVRGFDDDGLEDLLANASVAERTPGADGTERLRLERGGVVVDAVFQPADARRRGGPSLPDVAAYRLDRLLEIDLVPVAVRRELDGRVGTVQLPVDGLPDERQRQAAQASEAWCPLRDQFNALYAFDVLVHNDGRLPTSLRYSPDSWQLAATDHRLSFGTGTELPAYLRDVKIEIPPYLATRLAQLDATVLQQHLGDVLDERQRAAILTRRDRLLPR